MGQKRRVSFELYSFGPISFSFTLSFYWLKHFSEAYLGSWLSRSLLIALYSWRRLHFCPVHLWTHCFFTAVVVSATWTKTIFEPGCLTGELTPFLQFASRGQSYNCSIQHLFSPGVRFCSAVALSWQDTPQKHPAMWCFSSSWPIVLKDLCWV